MSPTRYRCAKSLRICSALNAHPELFPQAVIQKFTQCPRKIFIIRQAVIQNFSSCVSAFTSYQISVIQKFCHPEVVIQNFCHPEFCRPFHPVLWVSSAATVIRHICHPPGVIQKSGCYSAFLFFTFFRHGTGWQKVACQRMPDVSHKFYSHPSRTNIWVNGCRPKFRTWCKKIIEADVWMTGRRDDWMTGWRDDGMIRTRNNWCDLDDKFLDDRFSGW